MSARARRERKNDRARLRYARLPVLEGADLTTRRLALMEARSRSPGPLVWITAGIHGDELGAVVVVQELFRRLRSRPLLAGRVCAFPLLNPFGFETASRQIPSTREDLNRSFPGHAHGTFAERIAHVVHARILSDAPALVLDLHNDWTRSIPYALIDPRPMHEAGRRAHERARQAAAATELPVVDEQEEGVSRAVLRSTLSGSLLEAGVPAVTLELGAALVVDEEGVRQGLRAVWNVLCALGLVEADPSLEQAAGVPSGYRGRVLRYSHKPYPSCAGIARFRVAPGAIVAAGAPIADVHDVFGRLIETLRAEHDALVLGHADSSLVVPGMALVAMAMRRRH